MNISALLKRRQLENRPVTVALIGAGKYGAMFLGQARTTEGMHVAAVADLRVERIRNQLRSACWPAEQYAAPSVEAALRNGSTFLTDDAEALIKAPGIEVVIEATGDPRTGIRLASISCWSTWKRTCWPGRCWREGRRRPGWSTRWPGATSRRLSASTWTGRARAACAWSRRGRARATCRASINPRRTRCSTTSAGWSSANPWRGPRLTASRRGASVLQRRRGGHGQEGPAAR